MMKRVFLIFGVICILFLEIVFAQPTMPSGYSYYKPITVTKSSNGTSPANQVEIPIAYESQMKSDFSDIRFQDSSGNNLPYWIEAYTANTTAKVWVDFGNMGVGTTTIYMIYGNSSAVSESDIADVMVPGWLDFKYYNYSWSNYSNESNWNLRFNGVDSVSLDINSLPTNQRLINYDFGTGSVDLHGQTSSEKVILRWKGWLKMPSNSGTVSFRVGSDDGVRLYLDNNLEMDYWELRGYSTNTKVYSYTKEVIPIQYDYFEHSGHARVTLEWNASGSQQLIDRENFYTTNQYSTAPTVEVGEAVDINFSVSGNAELWMKANAGVNLESASRVNSWNDQANAHNASIDNVDLKPIFHDNVINFNPALRFDGEDDYLSISNRLGLGSGNQSRGTFVVARDAGTSNDIWAFVFAYGNASNSEGWHVGRNGSVTKRMAVGGYGHDILVDTWGNDFHLVSGVYNGTDINLFSEGAFRDDYEINLNTTITEARIGRQINALEEYWGGDIAEIIHYAEGVSGISRQKVESYLGLKYGITLNENYRFGNQIVYDVSTHNNDIAGIGRDTESSLDQRISSSSNTSLSEGSDITVASTNDFLTANTNSSRSALSDGSFLVWGHNAGNTNSWTEEGNYKRVNRFWKVENTGSVGNVSFQINLSGYPASSGGYLLIIDSDEDLSNGVSQTVVLNNSSGNLFSAEIGFPAGENFITVGTALPLTINLDSYNNIGSFGASDGMLTVSVSGGDGSYSYSWSNGANTAAISGLAAGSYTVTVSSAGVSTQKTFNLYDPDEIVAEASVVDPPTCMSDPAAEIDLEVTLPDRNCINFDGLNDYVALDDFKSGINAMSGLTVCAWVKIPAGQGGWSIIDYDRSEYFNVSIGDDFGGDNLVHFDTHSEIDNTTHDFKGSIIVADNTWHHITCVYDGEKKHIYVDGALDPANSGTVHNGKDLGSNETRFGFIGEGSEALWFNGVRNLRYFKGKIALVEVWHRALEIQEIQARMNSTANGPSLVGQWKLEEGTGNSTVATVGGDGTLYGVPTWETDSFYSVASYAWTKVGDGSFSASTEDISSADAGTYNCAVVILNGYPVNTSVIVNPLHQNINTNQVIFEN